MFWVVVPVSFLVPGSRTYEHNLSFLSYFVLLGKTMTICFWSRNFSFIVRQWGQRVDPSNTCVLVHGGSSLYLGATSHCKSHQIAQHSEQNKSVSTLFLDTNILGIIFDERRRIVIVVNGKRDISTRKETQGPTLALPGRPGGAPGASIWRAKSAPKSAPRMQRRCLSNESKGFTSVIWRLEHVQFRTLGMF